MPVNNPVEVGSLEGVVLAPSAYLCPDPFKEMADLIMERGK